MSSEQMERELLELAAKAAGIVGTYQRVHLTYGDQWVDGIQIAGNPIFWNPLTDDGDALRLAVKLGIIVAPPAYNGGWQATASAKADETPWVDETSGSHEQATRRCIVRAAAQLAKGAEK